MPTPRRAHRPRKRQSHDTPATTARDLIARVLTAQAARFPEIEPVELSTQALPDREAALAHALYDAAIRRWLTLEWLIDRHMTQPFRGVEPALQAVLLTGVAQLALFDRLPAHAVVDEAVAWAKRRIRPGAGSLVNAVLRKTAAAIDEPTDADTGNAIPLPDGRWRPLTTPLPDDRLERLAITTSTPPTVLRRWRRHLSFDDATAAAHHALARPPTILNTRHADQPLPDTLAPHAEPGHHLWTGDRQALTDLLESHADLWAQDPASTGAVRSAHDLRPALVADLCAGQGTKTRQLAATFPDAQIVASDVDERRFATLHATFEDHPRVQVLPPAEAVERLRGAADLILLDVPCSNTGVLARRVEARYRATPAALARLVDIQRGLIADGIPMLAPGGSILYATCSLEREENDDIAAWAITTLGLKASRTRRTHPDAPEGPATSVDGSYSVLLTPQSPPA
ncbi:MAG: transcription antitermination factor NusB [Planctomycetota bacterium]